LRRSARTGTSAPTIGSVASNKAALLVGFAASAIDTNQTIGSGFTMIDTNNNPNGAIAMALDEEYKSISSATSGQTVNLGSSWNTWAIIADAIEGL
jgi:hypothetical protein